MTTTRTSTKKPTSKKATKKKVAPVKAKSERRAAAKTGEVTADSMLFVIEGSREPTMPKRKVIKRSVPASGVRASDLMAKTDCTLRTLNAMIRRGFIETR